MEITVKMPKTIEPVAIRVVAAVRYKEEDMPNDYPHRSGETWDVTIDLDTGQIHDWPQGVEPRDLYMKVVDEGSYYLLGTDKVLASREQEYVPSCIPGEYGDYINFKIDGSGRITNWKVPSEDDLREEFFSDDE